MQYPSALRAQGTAGTNASLETRYLIDMPTAGLIRSNALAFDVDFFQSGGILMRGSVGLIDRVLVGISYGGANLLGTESVSWNKTPGFALKVRLVEETSGFPALALGFDSQGKGAYVSSLERYQIKSPGFFAVFSKNYAGFGFIAFHGGVNYSLERSDGDEDINFFGGIEQTIGPFLSVVGEYNLGMNDSDHEALGRGRGYLNAGIRASLGSGLTLSFVLKDMLQNQQQDAFAYRTISFEYVERL
jgi:hypothetical protein